MGIRVYKPITPGNPNLSLIVQPPTSYTLSFTLIDVAPTISIDSGRRRHHRSLSTAEGITRLDSSRHRLLLRRRRPRQLRRVWPEMACNRYPFRNLSCCHHSFLFPSAPSAAKGVLLLLRSWSPPQRAIEFVWVITYRVGVSFLVCLLAVGQKSMGTTIAAAMVAITLLPLPYATKNPRKRHYHHHRVVAATICCRRPPQGIRNHHREVVAAATGRRVGWWCALMVF
ncbi:unnamed protein product [Lactuca saligna]|uniref:Uncharacterized protein n=1 Tax=Lactuca saligna TaxID=75948 RepID=A0AA35Y7U2_LACSI|nr:unnamed protein product [Lactuca saligna]